MAALFLYSVAAIIIFSSLAWYFARKDDTWFDWDWLLCVLPTFVWFMLIGQGIGPQTQDQVIELVCLTGLIPLLLTFRVFVLDKLLANAKRSSIIVFSICMVAPVFFRFALPAYLG